MSHAFEHLRSFHMLADCLNYGRAAATLNIDQSTLTRRINNLELSIDFKLFERSKNKTVLTGAGKRFHDQTRKIVEDYEKSVREAKLLSSSHPKKLTVGYMAFAAMEIAPKHIAKFKTNHPNIPLKLRYVSSQNQLAALINEEIDIGYIIGRIRDKKFLEVVVAKERLVVLFCRGHKFEGLQEIPPNLLMQEQLILGDIIEWNSFRWRLEDMFARHKVSLPISLEATSTLAILGLVSAGLGLTIYPKSITNFIKNEGLIARPLCGEDFSIETSVICRNNDNSLETKCFMKTLKKLNYLFSRNKLLQLL